MVTGRQNLGINEFLINSPLNEGTADLYVHNLSKQKLVKFLLSAPSMAIKNAIQHFKIHFSLTYLFNICYISMHLNSSENHHN